MKKLLLSASLALAFTAIQGQTAFAQTAITVGSDVDAGTLDPRLTRDVTASRVADLIYSGLVHLDPNAGTRSRSGRKLGDPGSNDLYLPPARWACLFRWIAADGR